MFGALADMAVGVGRWRTSYKLGLQDIALRYKRSVLGPFWISATLVATVLALAYVFSAVFQEEFVTYIAFLACGMLAWQLISTLVNESCSSIMEHAAYIQNVRMPMTVIAGRVVFRNAVIFVHNLVAVIGVLLMFGVRFEPVAFLALPGAGLILVFGYFLVMVMGPLCTRFRDVPQAVQSIMQVIFFLTPIFWMPSAVSDRPMFTHANPFYHFIELVRAPMLGHEPTLVNWQVALWCCAGVAIAAVLSVTITRKRINLWL